MNRCCWPPRRRSPTGRSQRLMRPSTSAAPATAPPASLQRRYACAQGSRCRGRSRCGRSPGAAPPEPARSPARPAARTAAPPNPAATMPTVGRVLGADNRTAAKPHRSRLRAAMAHAASAGGAVKRAGGVPVHCRGRWLPATSVGLMRWRTAGPSATPRSASESFPPAASAAAAAAATAAAAAAAGAAAAAAAAAVAAGAPLSGVSAAAR